MCRPSADRLRTRRLRYARTVANDAALVARLPAGDESAFRALIEMYHAMLVRVARMYVSTQAVAEEVAQETWLAVLEGVDRFEGRSSLKTWMFRILTNCAKTRAQREGRSLPFSSFPDVDMDQTEPTVDPDRFPPSGHQWTGHWASFPADWRELPEQRLLSQEMQAHLKLAIAELSPTQREIIIL